jgi:hypothetical protein
MSDRTVRHQRWHHRVLGPQARLSGTCVALTTILVACGGPVGQLATRYTVLPNTLAGKQARWLFGAAVHAPIATSVMQAHFDSASGESSTSPDREPREPMTRSQPTGDEMVLSVMIAATHSTEPWYVAVPIVAVSLGLMFWRSRRGGGGGRPFRRGPFGGSGDDT